MKLVLIEWLDSHSGDGWQRLGDIARATHPVLCRSVGWLVSDENGHRTIVPHISGDGVKVGQFGRGDLTIPTKAIVRMKVLKAR
jgi:hypothetical protein